ncbi:DUF1198 family protein [Acerihabitans arboris]|uniref:DUF1198 family protein n=1 Tax=Acerihabitans arboris TaxID=2691583 RepID=A0A845SFD8_9GAMM|nr:DUF1198 family protein [Acerihabitans arboris]NDL61654.1 DUF1198 family protein [Acerihabitans arboris]
MIWLILATMVVVFLIGFRILNSDARRASQALTRRLNIEPLYVESMLSQMGKIPGGEFVNYLLHDSESHLGNAAGVLLIYQTLIVDDAEESLVFWHSVLRKARLPTELTHKHVRLALAFLRELEPEADELAAYRQRYNALFASAPNADPAVNGNVYYLDGLAPKN